MKSEDWCQKFDIHGKFYSLLQRRLVGRNIKVYVQNKWWWNGKQSNYISELRRLWKLWKAGGSKDKYFDAKWKA